MVDDYTTTSVGYSFAEIPKPTWKVYITKNFCMEVVVPPNRFHRFMQKLTLGFEWVKL